MLLYKVQCLNQVNKKAVQYAILLTKSTFLYKLHCKLSNTVQIKSNDGLVGGYLLPHSFFHFIDGLQGY